MKIEVIQEDIDRGTKSSYACPIAIAVARITGQFASVSCVSVFCYNYTTNQKGKRIYLPMEAQRFVIDFDAGKKVVPFSFELNL